MLMIRRRDYHVHPEPAHTHEIYPGAHAYFSPVVPKICWYVRSCNIAIIKGRGLYGGVRQDLIG